VRSGKKSLDKYAAFIEVVRVVSTTTMSEVEQFGSRGARLRAQLAGRDPAECGVPTG
jgi:hypothetical protein